MYKCNKNKKQYNADIRIQNYQFRELMYLKTSLL